MTRTYAKIMDHNHLIRDMGTQAVLNTDLTVVRKHEKRMLDMAKEEVRATEIKSLKSELAELRELLKNLTGK